MRRITLWESDLPTVHSYCFAVYVHCPNSYKYLGLSISDETACAECNSCGPVTHRFTMQKIQPARLLFVSFTSFGFPLPPPSRFCRLTLCLFFLSHFEQFCIDYIKTCSFCLYLYDVGILSVYSSPFFHIFFLLRLKKIM